MRFGKLHLTLSGEKIMCKQDFVAWCVDRQVVPNALAALQSLNSLEVLRSSSELEQSWPKKNHPGIQRTRRQTDRYTLLMDWAREHQQPSMMMRTLQKIPGFRRICFLHNCVIFTLFGLWRSIMAKIRSFHHKANRNYGFLKSHKVVSHW